MDNNNSDIINILGGNVSSRLSSSSNVDSQRRLARVDEMFNAPFR